MFTIVCTTLIINTCTCTYKAVNCQMKVLTCADASIHLQFYKQRRTLQYMHVHVHTYTVHACNTVHVHEIYFLFLRQVLAVSPEGIASFWKNILHESPDFSLKLELSGDTVHSVRKLQVREKEERGSLTLSLSF